jgi:hypothetical protein
VKTVLRALVLSSLSLIASTSYAQSGFGVIRIDSPLSVVPFSCTVSPCEGTYHSARVQVTHKNGKITQVDVFYARNSDENPSAVLPLAKALRLHSFSFPDSKPYLHTFQENGEFRGLIDVAYEVMYYVGGKHEDSPVTQISFLPKNATLQMMNKYPLDAETTDALDAEAKAVVLEKGDEEIALQTAIAERIKNTPPEREVKRTSEQEAEFIRINTKNQVFLKGKSVAQAAQNVRSAADALIRLYEQGLDDSDPRTPALKQSLNDHFEELQKKWEDYQTYFKEHRAVLTSEDVAQVSPDAEVKSAFRGIDELERLRSGGKADVPETPFHAQVMARLKEPATAVEAYGRLCMIFLNQLKQNRADKQPLDTVVFDNLNKNFAKFSEGYHMLLDMAEAAKSAITPDDFKSLPFTFAEDVNSKVGDYISDPVH